MNNFVINGRFLIHRVTGVERYARELLDELDKIVDCDEIELAIPPEVTNLPKYKNIKIIKVGRFHNRLWEHISFPHYASKRNAVPINLCNVAPLFHPGIVCIHDVKIKACPQYFSKKFLIWYNLLFNNAMKKAKLILTVSEFSKKEIIKYYHIDPDRIKVIPDAWQHYNKISFDENAIDKYQLKKQQYYFSMCSLEPNKNFKWIAEVARRNPTKQFAISGSINNKVFADGLGFECPENMKLLGYVSDEEAKTLMRECEAFLFPTIYEGFGIPPLEALSAGARSIVVSDSEVMHEIFGDYINFVDQNTYNIDLSNPVVLKSVSELERSIILSKYSWHDSACMLYEIIRNFRELI